MKQPDARILRGVAMAVTQHKEVLEWLRDVLATEMQAFPYATGVNQNPAVFQGRCQILLELIRAAEEFPAAAAKFR